MMPLDLTGYGDRPIAKESPGFSSIGDALDAIQLRRYRQQALDDEMKRAEMQNARIREVAEMQEAGEMARSRAARALEARKLATEGFTKSILPELQKDKPHVPGVQALGALYGVPVEPIVPQGPQGPRPELEQVPMSDAEAINADFFPQFKGTQAEQGAILEQQSIYDAQAKAFEEEKKKPQGFRVSVPGAEEPLVVRAGQLSTEKAAFADKTRANLRPIADMYRKDPQLGKYVSNILEETVAGAKVGDPEDKVAKDFRDAIQKERDRINGLEKAALAGAGRREFEDPYKKYDRAERRINDAIRRNDVLATVRAEKAADTLLAQISSRNFVADPMAVASLIKSQYGGAASNMEGNQIRGAGDLRTKIDNLVSRLEKGKWSESFRREIIKLGQHMKRLAHNHRIGVAETERKSALQNNILRENADHIYRSIAGVSAGPTEGSDDELTPEEEEAARREGLER